MRRRTLPYGAPRPEPRVRAYVINEQRQVDVICWTCRAAEQWDRYGRWHYCVECSVSGRAVWVLTARLLGRILYVRRTAMRR